MANPGGFEAIKARSGANPGDLQMMAKQIEKIINMSEQQTGASSEKGATSSNPQKQQIVELLSEILPLLNTVANKNSSGQQA